MLFEANYIDTFDKAHTTRFCQRAYKFNGDFSMASPGFNVASIPCIRFNQKGQGSLKGAGTNQPALS